MSQSENKVQSATDTSVDAKRFELFKARNAEIELLRAIIKSAPEAIANPPPGWCEAYADWVSEARVAMDEKS